MAMLLSVFLLMGAGGPLSISVSAPKTDLVVGEPVKLVLRWRAPRQVDVHMDDQNHGFRYLQFLVGDGSGLQRYCEASRAPAEALTVLMLPKSQAEVVQNVVLLRGSYGEGCTAAGNSFPFSSPGTYTLKVAYSAGGLRAESNSVVFNVAEPKGKDREVFGSVVRDPGVLLDGGSQREKLLREYPDSPYLRFARMRDLEEREIKLHGRVDPDTGASLWNLSQLEYETFCTRYHRHVAEELLSSSGWDAFEEERLQLAASHAEQGDDQDTAERLKTEILQRFPRSQALQQIKDQEGEDDEEDGDEVPQAKPTPKPKR